MSVLPDTLKDFNYYLKKVPLYLQNSHGFIEHFRIWFDFLIGEVVEEESIYTYYGIVPSADLILELFNIFGDDFLNTIRTLEDSGADFSVESDYGDTSDILDKLGSIFAVKRIFSISYVNTEGTTISKQLSLNNYDFLILIKCQIIKNYCFGNYEQIREYYAEAKLDIVLDNVGPAECDLWLDLTSTSGETISTDVQDMFLSGLLTIESVGIKYTEYLSNLSNVLVWDKENSESTDYSGYWDNGVWLK